MKRLRFGIIADDYTGATDAAGMLTEQGVRTLLSTGRIQTKGLSSLLSGYEALVIGLPTRSVNARQAYREVFRAARSLGRLGVAKVQIKYCSTFDSTKSGNIGPSLDAAIKALSAKGTIVCPALPVNGRTVYMGNLFVRGVPLSESPMRHHPLNPMTDSNIVRWLSFQTRKKVSLISADEIRKGGAALGRLIRERMASGERYLVTDAINDEDLECIAQATLALRLISGGSGITSKIPSVLYGKRRPLSFGKILSLCRPGTFAVAGSCSPATRAQNARALAAGFLPVRVNGLDILSGRARLEETVIKAEKALRDKGKALLYTSADPDEVKKVQAQGRRRGLSETSTGRKIGAFLAEATQRLVQEKLFGRLILSGGETSGGVLDRLGWTTFEVGLPIEPGVPFCFPLLQPGMALALKSGNFGSPDLYSRVEKTKG
jgi:3-dehydrotetronate 4-kinase